MSTDGRRQSARLSNTENNHGLPSIPHGHHPPAAGRVNGRGRVQPGAAARQFSSPGYQQFEAAAQSQSSPVIPPGGWQHRLGPQSSPMPSQTPNAGWGFNEDQYEEYNDDDDHEGSEEPRGGANNDKWPLEMFHPAHALAGYVPVPAGTGPSLPPPQQIQNPDSAPLRRRRPAEPEITSSEFRAIVSSPPARPPTETVLSSDATNPVPVLPGTPGRRTVSNPELPFTPYTRRLNTTDGSKPKLDDQSPPSTSLAAAAAKRYRTYIVATLAFPTRLQRAERIGQILADASAHSEKGERRLKRYKADKPYQQDMDKLIGRVASQVRGTLIKSARDLSGQGFGLYGLSEAQVITVVTELLATQAYHFRELDRQEEEKDGVIVKKVDGKIIERHGPYRHALFELLIRKEYFQDHGRMASQDLVAATFNPVPNEVIALVATAIHCSLDEWKTGRQRKAQIKFEETVYKAIYEAHLTKLQEMTDAAPDMNHKWRRWLFSKCSAGMLDTSGSAQPVVISRNEMTDYSDVPM